MKRQKKSPARPKALRKGASQAKVMTLGRSLNHNQTLLRSY